MVVQKGGEMTEHWFTDPGVLERLHSGPLGPHVDSFAALLAEQGYARSTAREHLHAVARLSKWLRRRRLDVSALDEQCIKQFLCRRWRDRSGGREAVALRGFLEHTREAGVVPSQVEQAPNGPIEELLERYARYLRQERGLSTGTVYNHLLTVRRFLSERFGPHGPIVAGEIASHDASDFVCRHVPRFSASAAKGMVSVLRVFFRFLRLRGEIVRDLAAAVPTVAHWRLSSIPRWIEPAEVERVLGTCDRKTITGQRNYAILLLLARLGLRAGEVAVLMLDDLDWEAAEITVSGKGGRRERLPLPRDVGQALAKYLRHARPRCTTRRVFVRRCAPQQGVHRSTISHIAERAVTQAGIQPPRNGAHLLRHSLATSMLRGGASLADIGQVLRHSLLQTTQIYAKVDLGALRALAEPWPGGAR